MNRNSFLTALLCTPLVYLCFPLKANAQWVVDGKPVMISPSESSFGGGTESISPNAGVVRASADAVGPVGGVYKGAASGATAACTYRYNLKWTGSNQPLLAVLAVSSTLQGSASGSATSSYDGQSEPWNASASSNAFQEIKGSRIGGASVLLNDGSPQNAKSKYNITTPGYLGATTSSTPNVAYLYIAMSAQAYSEIPPDPAGTTANPIIITGEATSQSVATYTVTDNGK